MEWTSVERTNFGKLVLGCAASPGAPSAPAVCVETNNKGAHDLCHRFSSAQHTRHIDRKLFKLRELTARRRISDS